MCARGGHYLGVFLIIQLTNLHQITNINKIKRVLLLVYFSKLAVVVGVKLCGCKELYITNVSFMSALFSFDKVLVTLHCAEQGSAP